ncbi:MAG: M20/M25/M40 family metallo-hydrolase [Bacteroides sp.]|nr:M20/M25/M40 family metallo-hydrolase [Bacteroides sp.]MCM1447805.1 M20/M25/M40 family metallo-hydrolase [Bacteroides sp.]
MKRKHILAVFLSLLVACHAVAQKAMERGLATIDRATAEAHIRFLAADELMGRDAGSNEGRVAANYIASQLRQMGVQPLLEGYFQPFEAYCAERQRKGRWEVHPDSLARLGGTTHRRRSMRNVLGVIPGKRTDEYVVIGAHYDHLGTDPLLEGDCIYNGADDNASGVSAVLQLARAFVASGSRPERTVVFAFWDGEELGLLGSRYFVQTHDCGKKLCAYLNYDMIGRNKYPDRPWHVVYFYTEAHPAFGEWLRADIKKYGLRLEPDYRPWDKPVGGSDNASFAGIGVPVIWYHTDGHPDYHQPGDHAERINWDKVVEITKASFLNAWRMANEEEY